MTLLSKFPFGYVRLTYSWNLKARESLNPNAECRLPTAVHYLSSLSVGPKRPGPLLLRIKRAKTNEQFESSRAELYKNATPQCKLLKNFVRGQIMTFSTCRFVCTTFDCRVHNDDIENRADFFLVDSEGHTEWRLRFLRKCTRTQHDTHTQKKNEGMFSHAHTYTHPHLLWCVRVCIRAYQHIQTREHIRTRAHTWALLRVRAYSFSLSLSLALSHTHIHART